jgi:hypothetical protein
VVFFHCIRVKLNALQSKFANDIVGANDRVATLSFGEGVTCGYPTQYNCFQVVDDASANCGIAGANHRFVKHDANHRQVRCSSAILFFENFFSFDLLKFHSLTSNYMHTHTYNIYIHRYVSRLIESTCGMPSLCGSSRRQSRVAKRSASLKPTRRATKVVRCVAASDRAVRAVRAA